MSKSINAIYVILSFLTETDNSAFFVRDTLAAWYGDDVASCKGLRKAAKFAVKHSPNSLNDEDILAMEARFLDKLGFYGRQYEEYNDYEREISEGHVG